MKVALVHDWITGLRGGERCLIAFLKMYPDADIYTLLHVPGSTTPEIDERVVGTSFLQRFPKARRFYRFLLPFYPRAARSLEIKGYDLVISLSHAAAKNIEIKDEALHLCYCFTPMRYVWDQASQYFGVMTEPLRPLINSLRRWDLEGSERVDGFSAISRFVAARIRCFYRRRAVVIPPPVDTEWISTARPGVPGEAFLYAGALVPYKNPDAVVRVFNELRLPLWIAGDGPERLKLMRMAGPNIRFLGRVSDEELSNLFQRCRALLFPGCEDFGLIPLECMAAGRPVIALDDGALRETHKGLRPWVEPNPTTESFDVATGVFVKNIPGRLDGELLKAIRFFLVHEDSFQVRACIARASEYSPLRFARGWEEFLIESQGVESTSSKIFAMGGSKGR